MKNKHSNIPDVTLSHGIVSTIPVSNINLCNLTIMQ